MSVDILAVDAAGHLLAHGVADTLTMELEGGVTQIVALSAPILTAVAPGVVAQFIARTAVGKLPLKAMSPMDPLKVGDSITCNFAAGVILSVRMER